MNTLVTGGAGYIGSHMVRALLREGHKVTVVDDLSTGRAYAIDPRAKFDGPLKVESSSLLGLLERDAIDTVFHFAAKIQVGESVKNPIVYYASNTAATVHLLEAVLFAKIPRLIFSSTAAVYGNPIHSPILESASFAPASPYGQSKAMMEQILADSSRAHPDFRYVALRYFNAAGADPAGDLGEDHENESHLIPLLFDAAMGRRSSVSIYGEDYPTADGTCVRDYIHVCDLVNAHLAACRYLLKGGASDSFNVGSGQGVSVRNMIQTVELVTGRKLPMHSAKRRDGDPAELVAATLKAEKILGWKPERSDLETLVEDAWRWHRSRFS